MKGFLVFFSVFSLAPSAVTATGAPPASALHPAKSPPSSPLPPANPLSEAPPAAKTAPLPLSEQKKALQDLQFVLKKYRNKNIQMRVIKKTYIAALQKEIVEKGDLLLSRGRFRLSMSGDVSGGGGSLMIFDGENLWIQPSRSEKTALKLKKHPQIGLFSSLFDYSGFFKFFSVEPLRRQKKKGPRLYILRPKQPAPFSHIVLSVGKNINGAQIAQADSADRQTYSFSGLWFKKTTDSSLFRFQTAGFEIIEKK